MEPEIAGHLQPSQSQAEQQTIEVPPPEVFAEAMMPELSGEFITLCGQQIQLKPLKLKYKNMLVARVGRVVGSLGKAHLFMEEFKETNWPGHLEASADWTAAVAQDFGIFAEILYCTALNDDKQITLEDIENEVFTMTEMVELARKAVLKQNWDGGIHDFFENVLPTLLQRVHLEGVKLMQNILNPPAAPSSSTASSSPSAPSTTGELASA